MTDGSPHPWSLRSPSSPRGRGKDRAPRPLPQSEGKTAPRSLPDRGRTALPQTQLDQLTTDPYRSVAEVYPMGWTRTGLSLFLVLMVLAGCAPATPGSAPSRQDGAQPAQNPAQPAPNTPGRTLVFL